jgi:hypothetical protein
MARGAAALSILSFASSCSFGGCGKYASAYSCSYVEDRAEYEVWYWRHVEKDDEADNKPIAKTIGLERCEDSARMFAAAIGEPFTYRSYVCVLMDDGDRMEKHRFEAE